MHPAEILLTRLEKTTQHREEMKIYKFMDDRLLILSCIKSWLVSYKKYPNDPYAVACINALSDCYWLTFKEITE